VRTKVDARLWQEIAHYRLRFSCEDCAQFVPELGTCSAGYPNAEHRRREQPSEIVFCKEFELT